MADIARDLPVAGRAAVPALLRPAAGDCGVILMHGSAGDMNSGRLPMYTDALVAAGFSVLRFTIKPPSMPTRIKCCQAVLDTAKEVFPEAEHVTRWILGGHSMVLRHDHDCGARVASQCASDNADAVPGVIFSSYPLHPPGEQDKLRDEPLASLQLPILFVRGTRDQFCDDGPWEEVRPRLTSPDITVHTVEGGDHGLKVKGGKAADEAAMDAACQAIISFVQRVAGSDMTMADGPANEANGTADEPAEEEEEEEQAGKAAASKKRSRGAKAKPAKEAAAKQNDKKSARSSGAAKVAGKAGKTATPAKPKAAPRARTKAAAKPAKAATPSKRKTAAKPADAKGKAASKPAAKAATPAKRKAAAPADAKAAPKAAAGKRKRASQPAKEKQPAGPKASEQKVGKGKGKASKAQATAPSKSPAKRAKRS